MKIQLRAKEGVPVLGTNMHVLNGHQRIDFVEKYYVKGDVLDAGSGQGGFSLYLQNLGCNVTMLDILPAEPPHKDIKFILGSVYDLPDTPKWDTILLMEIIEHLEYPENVISRCWDALKPGGRILITTPWVSFWDYVEDHVWRFDQAGVDDLLAEYPTYTETDNIFVYAIVTKDATNENTS